MTSSATGSQICNQRFWFKHGRPRIAALLAISLAGALFYFSFYPAVLFGRPDHGRFSGIDAILRSLPPAGRSVALLAMSLSFVYLLVSFYLPCILNDGLVVFNGRSIAGFDRIGRIKSVSVSDVRSVVLRSGSAIVVGPEGAVRIPLSLMQLDGSEERAMRSLLRDAGA